MEKPKVGQTVYSLNVGNAARKREQVLTKYRVEKVARKYFTVRRHDDDTGWTDLQFHIDGWKEKTDYSPTHRLYTSPQALKDEKESDEICRSIYKAFDYRMNRLKLSLDDLRKIKYILDTGGEKCGQ